MSDKSIGVKDLGLIPSVAASSRWVLRDVVVRMTAGAVPYDSWQLANSRHDGRQDTRLNVQNRHTKQAVLKALMQMQARGSEQWGSESAGSTV